MTVLQELAMRPAPAGRWSWNATVATRLFLAGTVIFTLLVGANLATPLYPLLQERIGFDSVGVTVAFTAYVVALIGGLVLFGHWSDHIGRRAALVLAVVVGLAGGFVFGTADSLPQLVAGRSLQGLAVAIGTGASAAALRDLMPSRPEWASRFTLLSSSGGVAAGPVIGGLLSLLPEHTQAPFAVHSVLLLGLLVPLLLLDARPAINPAPAGQGRSYLRPRRPALARSARGTFWLAAVTGFVSFAVFGFCLSLAPGYFAQIMQADSRPLIGLLAAVTLGCSALSQLLSLRGRFLVPAGLLLLGVSVLLIAAAGALESPLLLVLASISAGLGQGAAFRVVFNDVAGAVEPSRHAQVISAVYIVTYLGSAVPVLGLGLAVKFWGLQPSVTGFAIPIAAACAVLALVAHRRTRPAGVVP
ncbi:MFS transporter [Arthrobacter livingstonensis]|uniref:MFS transporter n=1 Tax=Arthrobacter livingstonensis TaxID=670078 RepID=A0A2V5LZJ6_9MICC|nr:MFS transporter [Arthrobacter livingstonensis]PYI69507.1 MFS transporter [Arthrobacter livingstonensis]